MTNLLQQDSARPLDSLLDGWVDFTQSRNEAPPHFSDQAFASGRLDTDCLALRFDPRAAVCGMRGPLLIVCIGAPRFAGESSAATEAAGILDGWAEAYGRAQLQAAGSVAGDYAVFIADFSARRALLACDRFLRRTLCFGIDGSRLSFADRADVVARRRGSTYDQQALYNYLWFHFIPAPQTVFEGVQRLQGGHTAALEGSRLSVQKHWLPAFEESSKASYRTLRAEFRELLHQAMVRQAHGKVGCFLSGGTDSSTIAGMLKVVTGEPARSYSIGFAATGYDETEYARIAARHFDCRHREHYISPDELVAAIPHVAAAYDQPFGNSSTLPAYYCAVMARNDGLDRLLGGDGGDEFFGGNSRYALQQLLGAYNHLPAVLRGLITPVAGWAPLADIPVLNKGASYVAQATVRMPDRFERYNLLSRLGPETVLQPEWLAQVQTDQPIEAQRRVYEATPGRALINRMLAYDWKYTVADNDLPKVITTCTLAGIDAGFPFLDDDLVDFSLRLPPHYKLRGMQLRWFFKKALDDFLPPEIIRKKKHGFGLPFGRWATQHAGLYELASGTLESLRDRGWVRPDFMDELLRYKLHEHPGYYGEMVWILMMLELWLQSNHTITATSDLRPREPALA